MTNSKAKQPTLEEAMQEVSALIDKMEHQELSLEQSLGHFEKGIGLIKTCQKMLTEAEQKVQMLIQNHGQETLVDYQTQEKT